MGVRNVLLDIEGTICPISFVKDTLFPYALSSLPTTLEHQWSSPALAPYISAFPPEHRTSPAALQSHIEDLTRRDVKVASLKNLQGYLWEEGYRSGAYATPLFGDVVPRLRAWKGDAGKGKVDGKGKGGEDAKGEGSAGDGNDAQGVEIAIYSSGSVFAQKLLFEHVLVLSLESAEADEKRGGEGEIEKVSAGTKRGLDESAAGEEQHASVEEVAPPAKKLRGDGDDGNDAGASSDSAPPAEIEAVQTKSIERKPVKTEDLRSLISGWFDTTNAGSKLEAGSYTKIVEELKWQADQTLFLSDNIKEIDAATEAGLKAILIDRPGNAPVSEEDRARVTVRTTFDDVVLE